MNIFKSFGFSLVKNVGGADPKKSVSAPAKKARLRPAPAPQHWDSSRYCIRMKGISRL